MGRNVRHRIFQHLKNREKSVRVLAEEKFVLSEMDSNCDVDGKGYMVGNTWVGPIQVDCDDVEYLVAEVWRNRCAVTGERMSVVLELTRWDMSRPSTCNNLVLMSTKAMKKFDSLGRKGMDGRVRRKIELRLSQCKIDSC